MGKNSSDRMLTIVIGVIAVAVILVTIVVAVGPMLRGADEQTTTSPNSTASATTQPAPNTAPSEANENDPRALLKKQIRRDPNDIYAQGKVDAPVVIVEYADYQCRFCRLWQERTLPEVEKLVNEGKVRYEWRDAPLVGGAVSERLAIAARAAGQQGKFWPYHFKIFQTVTRHDGRAWDANDLTELAKQVGVPDLDKFKADLNSAKLAAEVNQEMITATQELGLRSVPAFIINGTPLLGAVPTDQFMKVVNDELEKAKKS